MRSGRTNRALVWLFLAESVRANYRAYPRLPTAWLPHGVGNTLLLWMPEFLHAADRLFHLEEACRTHTTAAGLYDTIRELCVDNPEWGGYVAPAALGYAVSHPRFNIYKGDLGALRLFGFGLDAIPHSVTAFALTHLVQDGIAVLARHLPAKAPLAPVVRALAEHPSLLSFALLALLSAVWESGEYRMQQAELRLTGGDRSAINMEWDVNDMLFDLLSNAVGWVAADRQQRHRRDTLPEPGLADCSEGRA